LSSSESFAIGYQTGRLASLLAQNKNYDASSSNTRVRNLLTDCIQKIVNR